MPDTIDASEIEEITEEMISLRIAQFKPDFVGKTDKIIVMLEFKLPRLVEAVDFLEFSGKSTSLIDKGLYMCVC